MAKIVVTLGNVKEAIKEVEKYKQRLTSDLSDFILKLAEDGTEIARQNIVSYGAVDFGDLYNSMNYLVYADGNKAVIFNDSDHCAFVEFGTGVVGAFNSYPTNIPVGWSYASGSTIDEETGTWYFVNDLTGRHGYTQGQPSRPYMWDASQELRQRLTSIAKEVLKLND